MRERAIVLAGLLVVACSNPNPGFCGDGLCAGCSDGLCTETMASCPEDCSVFSTECGPTCATGCCTGTSCVAGTSPGACGAGGGPCQTCAVSFMCSEGACVVDPASRWNVVLDTLTVGATRYDGAAWDVGGGNPDPFVSLIIGSATATPVNSTSATDTLFVTFDGTPTATNVRADTLLAFIGFNARDDDSPDSSENIGYCGHDAAMGLASRLSAAAFLETTQTINCSVSAATMNSGFMLSWHLERF